MGEEPKNFDFIKGEVLLFDKALDWTSFDLVQKVRNNLCRAMKIKKLKVGHAGTLDPKATGLMILCTGKATKQIEMHQAGEKEYLATIKLGATTPSFDLETPEDEQFETAHITQQLVESVLQQFIGDIEQVPPVFSAVKIDGKRAYTHARKGEEVKMRSRLIRVRELELLDFSPEQIEIRVVCSKGTYIRALARDLGQALNSGAYLTGLRRTRIGQFKVEDALSVTDFLNNIDKFVTN
ncbi:tRNA pseudouridine(55) synthase TruB [Sunxiuqinia dokdonensis]|uniref:tRNA pseudouridine synthase B n=1 Tax=Sunxiuqinia dokdonensis TaxID=1409788 RepID=A0A0L8V664_9BACT|nr:tRNA pseudouridine(55) synthase TruB [Sunxiuqinia dokdonensis]KOH43985.1 tRNA pseudouridine synthase B [Sunxiuqinia dokdonensis]